jgi:superfamily II DNA/RNA helicase
MILIATPGRCLQHLQSLDGLMDLMTTLDTVIFDEADQLFDLGFHPDIEWILKLLNPSESFCQALLFSAMVSSLVSEITRLALHSKYNFVDTVGEGAEQTHEHVPQELLIVPQEHHGDCPDESTGQRTQYGKYKIIVFFMTLG